MFSTPRPSKYPLINPRTGAPIRIRGLRYMRFRHDNTRCGSVGRRDPSEPKHRDVDARSWSSEDMKPNEARFEFVVETANRKRAESLDHHEQQTLPYFVEGAGPLREFDSAPCGTASSGYYCSAQSLERSATGEAAVPDDDQPTSSSRGKRKRDDSDDEDADGNKDDDSAEPTKKKGKRDNGRPHAPFNQYDPTKGLFSKGIARAAIRASIPEILTLFPDEIKYNAVFVQRLVENGWSASMVSDYINHTRGLTEAEVGAFKRTTIAKQFKSVYGIGWKMGTYDGTPTSEHTLMAQDGEECSMAELLKDIVNLPDVQDQWELLPCLLHAKANPSMQYQFPSDLDQVRTLLPAEAIGTPPPSDDVDVSAGKRWSQKRDRLTPKGRGKTKVA